MADALPTTPVDARVGRKVCSKCAVAKPYEEFSPRVNRKHGRHSRCKACGREAGRNQSAVAKRESYERRRERLLDSYRIKNYGVTREQYDSMVEAQNGVCAICAQPETSRNKRGEIKQLAVDHDHNTGVVRGLLCARCNCGLGYFRDNLALLSAASAYLGSKNP